MRIFFGLCLLFMSYSVLADTQLDPLLNTVMLQLTAEQWVSTKTSLVTIGVNVSVNDNDSDKIQGQILTTLQQLVPNVEWRIVSLNRSQDQSGLEKIQVQAQARLNQAELTGLRNKTKSISKPGETYTIDNIEYTPSDEEVRMVNNDLRANIYQQAKDETDKLNKLYPDQKYYVHSINFLGIVTTPSVNAKSMMMVQSGASAESMVNQAITTSEKLRAIGTVILASAPNADVINMIHNERN